MTSIKQSEMWTHQTKAHSLLKFSEVMCQLAFVDRTLTVFPGSCSKTKAVLIISLLNSSDGFNCPRRVCFGCCLQDQRENSWPEFHKTWWKGVAWNRSKSQDGYTSNLILKIVRYELEFALSGIDAACALHTKLTAGP